MIDVQEYRSMMSVYVYDGFASSVLVVGCCSPLSVAFRTMYHRSSSDKIPM